MSTKTSSLSNHPKQSGQLFSVDVILALVTFLLVLYTITSLDSSIRQQIQLNEKEFARETAATNAAAVLLETSGHPSNWENGIAIDSIQSVGLVNNANQLITSKIQRLVDLNATNYDELRQKMGASRYGVELTILNLQTNAVLYSWGVSPGTSDQVSTINRVAILNGTNVLVRLKVFE